MLRAQLSGEETIVRVFFDDPPTGRLIAASWEPIESKYENGCLVVEVTAEQLQRLQQRGLRTEPVSAQELSTILAPPRVIQWSHQLYRLARSHLHGAHRQPVA